MAIVKKDDGTTVCADCLVADSARARSKGLLGRSSLGEEEGILLRFAIDAVFLDRELQVLRVAAGLKPWRLASKRGAKAVLELPAGRCAQVGLGEGDRLVLDL